MTETTETAPTSAAERVAERRQRRAEREAEALAALRVLSIGKRGARRSVSADVAVDADDGAGAAALALVVRGASVAEAERMAGAMARQAVTNAARSALRREVREAEACGIRTDDAAALRVLVVHEESTMSARRVTTTTDGLVVRGRCGCGRVLIPTTTERYGRQRAAWAHADGCIGHDAAPVSVRLCGIGGTTTERGAAPAGAALAADGESTREDRDAGRSAMVAGATGAALVGGMVALAGAMSGAPTTERSASGKRPAEHRRVREVETDRATYVLREGNVADALARWLTLSHATGGATMAGTLISGREADAPDGADRMRARSWWRYVTTAPVPAMRGKHAQRVREGLAERNAFAAWLGAPLVTFGELLVAHYVTTAPQAERAGRQATAERSAIRWTELLSACGCFPSASDRAAALRALRKLAQALMVEAAQHAHAAERDAVRDAGTAHATERAPMVMRALIRQRMGGASVAEVRAPLRSAPPAERMTRRPLMGPRQTERPAPILPPLVVAPSYFPPAAADERWHATAPAAPVGRVLMADERQTALAALMADAEAAAQRAAQRIR